VLGFYLYFPFVCCQQEEKKNKMKKTAAASLRHFSSSASCQGKRWKIRGFGDFQGP